MSRLWDTPEFWARSEADALLRDYPETEASELADMFERTAGGYDDDPDLARNIIAELRRRAAIGIRFWPTLAPVGSQAQPDTAGAGAAVARRQPAQRGGAGRLAR